jgi:phosphomethylpyrimidine synthase
MGDLVLRARAAGVQVIVEGPGHLRADRIPTDVHVLDKVAHHAPTYYMGPLVTDVAPGYDHITNAIGATLAAAAGADFLCDVTPAEHLSLPKPEDIFLGVIATRIAAHAGDLVKGIPGAQEWDDRLSRARYELDWAEQARQAIDKKKFAEYRRATPTHTRACSICADYCPMKLFDEATGEVVNGAVEAIIGVGN